VKISDKQIAAAASSAGFTGHDLTIAIAVALAESGGDTTARHVNNNGSTDYGLWQINSIHSQILASGRWDDANSNAKMAHQIWHDAGNKWTPWATYNSQRYRVYLTRAISAQGGTNILPNIPAPSLPTLPDLSPLMGLVQFVSDAGNWRRVGIFLAGLVITFLGLWGIVKDTGTGQAIRSGVGKLASAAKTTAEVAAIA
jgi:hypothetical protein